MRICLAFLLLLVFHVKSSAQSGELKLLQPLQHNYGLNNLQLIPALGTNRLLSICDNAPILFDLQYGISLSKLPRHNTDVFAAKGRSNGFISLGGDTLYYWDLDGNRKRAFSAGGGRGMRDFDVAESYIVGGGFEDVWVWNINTGKLISTVHIGYDSWSERVLFINRGKHFITLGTNYKGSSILNSNSDMQNHEIDSSLYIWETTTGKPIAKIKSEKGPINKLLYDSLSNKLWVQQGLSLKRYELQQNLLSTAVSKKEQSRLLKPEDKIGFENVLDFDIDYKSGFAIIQHIDLNSEEESVSFYRLANNQFIKQGSLPYGDSASIKRIKQLGAIAVVETETFSPSGAWEMRKPFAFFINLANEKKFVSPVRGVSMVNADYFVCHDGEEMQIRSIDDGRLIKNLPIHNNYLYGSFQNRNGEIGLLTNRQVDLFRIPENKKISQPFRYEPGNDRILRLDSILFIYPLSGGGVQRINTTNGEALELYNIELLSLQICGATGGSLYGVDKDTIKLINPNTGQITHRLPQKQINRFIGKRSYRLEDPTLNPKKSCSPVTFSDDNLLFAYTVDDSTASVREVNTNREIRRFSIPHNQKEEFSEIRFLDNSHRLIWMGTSGRVFELDPSSGSVRLLYELTSILDDVTQIWEPKGTNLLIAFTDINTLESFQKSDGRPAWKIGIAHEWVNVELSDDAKHFFGWDENGKVNIVEAKTGALLDSVSTGLNNINNCFLDAARNRLIVITKDASINIFDLRTTKRVIRLIDQIGSSHFSITDKNEYTSGKESVKNLFFQSGRQIISPNQLDILYNRPDKVMAALGSSDTLLMASLKSAWDKRVRRSGIQATTVLVTPEATINNRASVSFENRSSTLTLALRFKTSTGSLKQWNVWINAVPLFGNNGNNIQERGLKQLDTSVSLTLCEGLNTIEVSTTTSAGIESYKEPLIVTYLPEKPATQKLYFIGIGTDKFEDAKHNLQFCVKDIRDLARAITNRGREVVIDTLFDEQVTVDAVAALKNRLSKTNVNDKVIIAFSGHGLLNKELDYFLSTFHVDFLHPEKKGLPYSVLEDLLDSIPARQKLLLIDACHSGEVDKEEQIKLIKSIKESPNRNLKGGIVEVTNSVRMGMRSSFDLMQELFLPLGQATGTTIISAAAGLQLAQERNELKNGVFTFTILEYLSMHPTATIWDLKKYVDQRVPALTGGIQQPTSRAENTILNWSF